MTLPQDLFKSYKETKQKNNKSKKVSALEILCLF